MSCIIDTPSAIELIDQQATQAIRGRIAFNRKAALDGSAPLGDKEMAELYVALRNYCKQLRRLRTAVLSKSKFQIVEAKRRIFSGFAGRLVATVRATENAGAPLSFVQLEALAKELSLSKLFHETLTLFPRPKCGKPGEWRYIGLSGRYRKAQQLILRDVLSVIMGDSPCDSTVAGAGGERQLFQDLNNAIAEGYVYWVSLDVRNFFPSLRPGHLAGFPLSKWMIENILFLPPETTIKFADPAYGIQLDEQTILFGDESDLPCGYPYTMETIRSKFKKVRQELIQGDVCAPQIARMVLGRELQLSLAEWEVAYASHLDNVLLGARSLSDAKASIEALTYRLKNHPAGPLELHRHEVRHVKDDVFHLGYRIGLLKNGNIHVRPGIQRFDRFRQRLVDRFRENTALTKDKLIEIGLDYARGWFRSQPAWTKAEIGSGSSKCEGPSWEHVVSEVHLSVNRFIYSEYSKGTGIWHQDDVDFNMLNLAEGNSDLQKAATQAD